MKISSSAGPSLKSTRASWSHILAESTGKRNTIHFGQGSYRDGIPRPAFPRASPAGPDGRFRCVSHPPKTARVSCWGTDISRLHPLCSVWNANFKEFDWNWIMSQNDIDGSSLAFCHRRSIRTIYSKLYYKTTSIITSFDRICTSSPENIWKSKYI